MIYTSARAASVMVLSVCLMHSPLPALRPIGAASTKPLPVAPAMPAISDPHVKALPSLWWQSGRASDACYLRSTRAG